MINRNELLKSLRDWLNWFMRESQGLQIRSSVIRLPKELCLALTGVRRCGKTFTALQIAREADLLKETFYYNFEDPVCLAGVTARDIEALISLFEEERGYPPLLVILDEVQYVEGWEKWVRKAVDMKQFGIIVTGSSSRLLSSEFATAISGRVIEKAIWPLSFQEFVSFRGRKPISEGQWLHELSHYMRWGGFPKPTLLDTEEERIDLLKQYLSDIVLRDVLNRHKILNHLALNQIVSWYLTNIACLHSYTAIKNAFEISTDLAAALSSYLTEAYLAFELSRYHLNMKVQTRDPKKVYLIDNGLRAVSLLSEREDWGRLAENIVYIELRRRSKQVFYYKNKGEVDFLVTELGKPQQAIQVCFSNLEDAKTRQRELSSLVECLNDLHLSTGILLTKSHEETMHIGEQTVRCIPLYRWLLGG
jgi:predicted AAA+ superfamily ATPase